MLDITIMPISDELGSLPFRIEVDPVAPFNMAVIDAIFEIVSEGKPIDINQIEISTGSADIPIMGQDLEAPVEHVTDKYGFVFCIKKRALQSK